MNNQRYMYWLYGIFLCSGMTGLIYEISWERQIGLLFGHTAQSAGLVIGIYFIGMAIGYSCGGRLIKNRGNPLRYYALAEIIAGLWSFLIPSLLQLLASPFLLSLINHDDVTLRMMCRIIATMIILLPATIAIGFSFPAFVQFLTIHRRTNSVVAFYAVNTLGAFWGVVFSSTFLLYSLGVAGSSYLAASISLVCGAGAFVISQKIETKSCADGTGKYEQADASPLSFSLYWVALASGFGILGLEVLYTHLFSRISHNSTYNFAAVLGGFLLSMSLGSFLVSFITKGEKNISFLIGICLTTALTIPISLFIFHFVTNGELLSPTGNFSVYLGVYFFWILLILLLPISIGAMLLPLCWHLASRHGATMLGHLTAINTFSAAAGSLATNFLLIPVLGIYSAFVFFCILYLFAAGIVLMQNYGWKYAYKFIPVYIVALVCAFNVPETQSYRKSHEILWSRETAYGRIDVARERSSNNVKILQNCHYTLGSSDGELREKRQAHIPLLLHPNPQTIAFLGMGTGNTAQAALKHKQVREIVIVELIPAVVEAAKYFHTDTSNIFNDPKVKIIINDARHHLYRQKDEYDVIISDLFVPWHSHTGYLYTVEHYQSADRCLRQNGIFCQWLPLYQLGEEEFRMITDSFASVFPHVSLWRGEEDDQYPIMALIGSRHRLTIQEKDIERRLKNIFSIREVKIKLQEENVRVRLPGDRLLDKSEHFFSLYVGDWSLQDSTRLNTDEFPRVEFLAPIHQKHNELLQNNKLRQYYQKLLSRLPKSLPQ